jgi:transmembrane sensor
LPVWRIAAAAIVVGVVATAGWIWLMPASKSNIAQTEKQAVIKSDVAPGGNKAMLTLANGSTIVLDSAANGMLISQGNVKVEKLANGQLSYTVLAHNNTAVTYNTLSTPTGGQYQLLLPDGSKVWLNSASSITFPTAFTGRERKVNITGEAYFEVAHNSKMPFVVEKGRMAVEVLGTHFNINAYDDEDAVRTTLLEGKVKVVHHEPATRGIKNEQSAILKPGEQAAVSLSSHAIPVQAADVDVVMAWKNGLFHFENADVKTVMRQLRRWYDIEVEYRGAVKNEPLFVEVPRNTNLSDVLKVIESTTGLRLAMEGKKVIVL